MCSYLNLVYLSMSKIQYTFIDPTHTQSYFNSKLILESKSIMSKLQHETKHIINYLNLILNSKSIL